ncbi:hypothetical protein BLOT_002956 [Blomia tropicalis]|nr:hypothetical protein BLOT_002956 [Blomia tropicalis]
MNEAAVIDAANCRFTTNTQRFNTLTPLTLPYQLVAGVPAPLKKMRRSISPKTEIEMRNKRETP